MGRGHREWERARRSDELSDTVPIEGGGRGGEGAGPLLRERVGEVEGAIDGGGGGSARSRPAGDSALPTASLGNVMSRLPVRKGGPFRVGLCDRAVTDLKPGPASGLSPRRWPAGLAGRFALGLDAEEILLPLSGQEPWERQGAPYIRARAHVRMPAGFALGLDAAEPRGPRGPRGGEWANERERERERERKRGERAISSGANRMAAAAARRTPRASHAPAVRGRRGKAGPACGGEIPRGPGGT